MDIMLDILHEASLFSFISRETALFRQTITISRVAEVNF